MWRFFVGNKINSLPDGRDYKEEGKCEAFYEEDEELWIRNL